ACMEANPGTTLLLEGHCDERGTPSYNDALGERRAIALKNYLVGKGIESSRLNTVSYGDRKPMENGSTEYAWSKNRRAQWNFELAR
ncbi:MAG TPA: OmpA family protein, partial [Myxococcota bacterium]|nr:OmpA family protein [Myxococcota bacterium]